MLTLVPLLLDLKLGGQVLVLLPLDLAANGTIVHEITGEADLGLIDVGLFESSVLKELVGGEVEDDLESRGVLGIEVLERDVGEVLEGGLVTLGDELCDGDMVSEGCEPELGDSSGGGGCVLGDDLVLIVFLEVGLFTSSDLVGCSWCSTRDDSLAAFVQRLGKTKILQSIRSI